MDVRDRERARALLRRTYVALLASAVLIAAAPALAQEPAAHRLEALDERTCPSREALARALEAEELPESPSSRVEVREAGNHVEVLLPELAFTRTLALPSPRDAAACAALADAIAAVVGTALRGVAVDGHVPDLELAPPDQLQAAEPAVASGRAHALASPSGSGETSAAVSSGGRVRLDASLGPSMAAVFDRGPPAFGLSLWLGATVDLFRVALSASWLALEPFAAGPGTVEVVSFPIGVEAGVVTDVEILRVGVCARGELDVLHGRGQGLPEMREELGWAARAGVALTLALVPVRELELGLRANGLLTLSGQDLQVTGVGTVASHAPVAGMLTLYASAAIEP